MKGVILLACNPSETACVWLHGWCEGGFATKQLTNGDDEETQGNIALTMGFFPCVSVCVCERQRQQQLTLLASACF